MTQAIGDLFVGFTDGKHELDELTPAEFEQAFLVPEYISEPQLTSGKKFIVVGLRGTGKTSILRWHSIKIQSEGHVPIFILFKNMSEEKRATTSKIVGIKEIIPDSGSYKILQDFKHVWVSALIARIFEEACDQKEWVADISPCKKFLDIIHGEPQNKGKFFDILPKLSPTFTIPIKFPDPSLPETGLSVSFDKKDPNGQISIDDLAELAVSTIKSVNFHSKVYLYIDELEVFFKDSSTYNRDISLVRDLILSASELNRIFRKNNIPVYIIVAARTEVINNLGVIGEEISKLIDDYGFEINWARDQRSATHPLIRMMDRKLSLKRSDKTEFLATNTLIPNNINGKIWYHYLLDNTMFIPRNIVHRLNIARDSAPSRPRFDEDLFNNTEKKYSERLLRDLQLSLGAIYSDLQVRAIVNLFNGWRYDFRISDLITRSREISKYSPAIKSVMSEPNSLIRNLFYFGAIGNVYNNKETGKPMYIWAFREEAQPIFEERFLIHESIRPALNLIS
ncbi:P-loop ATPase, Sll1717 family [Bosea thiooxidans]